MISGKHPTLMSVKYLRKEPRIDRPECFQVIWKDDNGKLRCTEEPPDVDFYIVKPEFRNFTYNKSHEDIAKMDKVTVPYSKIKNRIAKEAGPWGESVIRRAIEMHDFKLSDELYRWPYSFGADFQPEFYFMREWYKKYPLVAPHFSKAYMDIEVDQIDTSIDMANPEQSAYAPINLITVNLADDHESYTFILKPYQPMRRIGMTDLEWNERLRMYEKQKKDHEWLMSHREEFCGSRCQREFGKVYGRIQYHIRDYEREIDLIADVFRLLEVRRPDFCLIWNMRFDIPYILGRIRVLGYDPASIICSPDIKYPYCRFIRDSSTAVLKKQSDVFDVTSFTKFVCQLRMFTGIRKSQHELGSVKLNSIMDMILGDHKVEYPAQTNIRTFAYHDWILFILYNIKDTLGQKGIEDKVNDILTWYMRSHQNLTPYSRVFREIHLLRNVRERDFERQGFVQANNINILNLREKENSQKRKLFYESDDDEDSGGSTFKGAIVADPMMNAKVGNIILGKPSNVIYTDVTDMDMSSFYPSIMILCNMDPSTLLNKASLVNREFIDGKFMNRSLNQVYFEKDKFGAMRELDHTGEAVHAAVSGNVLTFGYTWLALPSLSQLEQELIINMVA